MKYRRRKNEFARIYSNQNKQMHVINQRIKAMPKNGLREVKYTTEQLKSLKIDPLQTSKTFLNDYNTP